MSDNWIVIIPEDPEFVPDEAGRQAAVSYFSSIAPRADEVQASVSERVVFVDCGCNLESISCPSCNTRIGEKQWAAWMDEDFGGTGFVLKPHKMPCCSAAPKLSELRYDWPVGFARCEISAMNPRMGELLDEQIRWFERVLGCPIRVIYRHL